MLAPHPRTTNAFVRDGHPMVVKIPHWNGDSLGVSIGEAVRQLGGLGKVIRRGDCVMIKPNLNCSYALPLSTDLAFMSAAIEMLKDVGAKVSVGEMSGIGDWPTSQVVRNLNLLPMLKRYRVPFIDFQFDEWLDLEVAGEHWKSFRVPRSIYEAEKRVYLANMRCHAAARFTASLKLSVGWLDRQGRDYLHSDASTLEGKVAELNLGWQPNLVLLDGRRSTVTLDGRGEYVYPNVIMASGDMVAMDTEAVKILKSYPAKNGLDVPIAEMGQIKMAHKHRLGSTEYVLIEAPGRTHTEQASMFKDPTRPAPPAPGVVPF